MNSVYATTLESGVRVIAYRDRSNRICVAMPGVGSPGLDLGDALSSCVNAWVASKRMQFTWHGPQPVELSADQFVALDASCAKRTRFWLSQIA
jgi:hypothetical protein